MKYRKFIYTLATVMSALLTFSAGNVTAQTTANGPYYAWPSWDQTLPSSTRFIVLSNFGGAAVLDRETGLVWQKSPENIALLWANARDRCHGLSLGNRKGWRLPTIEELMSLVDPSVPSGLRLPAGHPFQNVQSGFFGSYWSASNSATAALEVDFGNGGLGGRVKNVTSLAWCVRGGQGLINLD